MHAGRQARRRMNCPLEQLHLLRVHFRIDRPHQPIHNLAVRKRRRKRIADDRIRHRSRKLARAR